MLLSVFFDIDGSAGMRERLPAAGYITVYLIFAVGVSTGSVFFRNEPADAGSGVDHSCSRDSTGMDHTARCFGVALRMVLFTFLFGRKGIGQIYEGAVGESGAVCGNVVYG